MTINCIGDCGAAYIQGSPGPLFDDSLIAAGWEHTPTGWRCEECVRATEEEYCEKCGFGAEDHIGAAEADEDDQHPYTPTRRRTHP